MKLGFEQIYNFVVKYSHKILIME